MARTYARDSKGRFAGGGGGGGSSSGGGKKASGGKKAGTGGKAGGSPKATTKAPAAAKPARKKATPKPATPKAAKPATSGAKSGAKGGAKSGAKGSSKAAAKPAVKADAASRKADLVKRVSSSALAGKPVSPAVRNYVRAQQGEKLRMASSGGKGNKAASRAAAAKSKAKPAAKPPAKSVADRKAALVKRVSADALAGKKVSAGVRGYVKAQQGEKLRMASSGKGNKAARRIAKNRR